MVVRRSSRPGHRVVDPMFVIPEGLEDLVYETESKYDDDGDLDDYLGSGGDPTTKNNKKKKKKNNKNKKKKNKGKKGGKKDKGGDKDGKLNVPKTLKVVKQKIRTKKDGSQVVDLTVEVDKINRAIKYEFRITQKDTGKTTVVTG